MTQHRVSASALIPAPAPQVYALLADYQEGHPQVLPQPHFIALQVEQGGLGAGTVIRFQMRLMGKSQTFRAAVSEPEPGRVLAETDLDTGAVTTFTVEPRDNERQALVTITTVTQGREGFAGMVEGWLTTRLLRPIYLKELEQLGEVAAKRMERSGRSKL